MEIQPHLGSYLRTIKMLSALVLANIALLPVHAVSENWIPDDLAMGFYGIAYKDPEFLSAEDQVVFRDSSNGLWVGNINPYTGFFQTATGLDFYLDQMAYPPSIPNGPEWIANQITSSVLYTKFGSGGYLQLWRASRPFASPNLAQLTNADKHSIGPLGSRDMQRRGGGVVFLQKSGGVLEVVAGPVNDLRNASMLPNAIARTSARWVYGLNKIVYQARDTNSEYSQVAIHDPVTGQHQILTKDAEDKSDVWGFRAPEYNYKLLVGAHLKDGGFAIYADLGAPDGYWRRIATLRLPQDSPYQFLHSTEPVETPLMGGDTTYFTAQGWEQDPEQAPNQGDVSIWVLGLGTDSMNRFARRVDEGAVSGDRQRRWDPESYIGENELFVYYNLFSESGSVGELRRCASGVPVAP